MRPPAVHRTFAYAETTFIRLRYAVDLFTAEPLSMIFPLGCRVTRRSGLGGSGGGSAAPGKTKKPRRFHIEALLILGRLASLTAWDTDAPARTGPVLLLRR